MGRKNKNTQQTGKYEFELQQSQPVVNEIGERDYFAEYYRTYKNDYIDQYLQAYRDLKNIDAAVEKVNASRKK